ncbi:MAG TPA: type II toxin-antitoxin system VapC family toxin [Gaiella sp.]
MIVLDASAAVGALAGEGVSRRIRARIDGERLHAPYLIEVEVLETLRRSALTKVISHDRAADARSDLVDLQITLYPHRPFAARVWELRDNLSAYDAVYVALAEALDAPLVTCDGRLARAPGVRARIEVFALGE